MSSAEPVWTDRRVVADLMLRNPKTLPGDASVADVHAVLDNPRVQLVLLTDGERFRGAVTELPAGADPAAPALDFAERSPLTIGPNRPPRRSPRRRRARTAAQSCSTAGGISSGCCA
jgi:hypothetical protein